MYNNESTEVRANPRRNSHTAIYSINILSKYSSLISHRCSKVDTSINHRSAKVDTSIIGLRRSTHPSPKVDTSISEGRHIVTSISEGRHIVTSIFEGRHIDHRSSKIEGGNITPTIRRRILSTTALLSPQSRRSYTRSYVYTYVHVLK